MNIIFRSILWSLRHLFSDKKFLPPLLSVYKINLAEEYEKYPSLLNPGYLHITKAIDLVKRYNLSEKNLIVDVGAAGGYVSSLFAEQLPNTTIFSFEPTCESYQQLCMIAQKYENIIPVNKALGMKANTMKINIANRVTASSLFQLNPQNDENFITQNINLVRKEEIIVSTLDEELPKDKNVNLLKLDVQGFELEVLKGATNTLKRTNIIIVEVCNHNYYLNGAMYFEIDNFLRTHDFELFSFIPSLRDKNKILEWDCIYKNKNMTDH